MAKIVSMINWKGGVGKTTLTLHLAAGLSEFYGKKVLLVDLDPQSNLSYLALGVQKYIDFVYKEEIPTLKTAFDNYFNDVNTKAKEIIHKNLLPRTPQSTYSNIDMILSHQELILLDLQLARNKKSGKDHKEDTFFEIKKLSILKELLQQVEEEYDYILIDCPPNVNLVTQNAFYVSDYYIVPARPDFLSTIGISLIKDYMNSFNHDFKGMHDYIDPNRYYKETEFGGIIFNQVNEHNGGPKASHKESIDSVKKQHSGFLFQSYVTDGDGITTGSLLNLPVYSYKYFNQSKENARKQAMYLRDVVDEFIARIV